MSYNLLDSQKDALRWIVKEVRAGKLPEEEMEFDWDKDGLGILNYDGDSSNVPDIKESTLKALRGERLLQVDTKGKRFYSVSLIPDAYEAVDQMEQ